MIFSTSTSCERFSNCRFQNWFCSSSHQCVNYRLQLNNVNLVLQQKKSIIISSFLKEQYQNVVSVGRRRWRCFIYSYLSPAQRKAYLQAYLILCLSLRVLTQETKTLTKLYVKKYKHLAHNAFLNYLFEFMEMSYHIKLNQIIFIDTL